MNLVIPRTRNLTFLVTEADLGFYERLCAHLQPLVDARRIRVSRVSMTNRSFLARTVDECVILHTHVFLPILSPELFESPCAGVLERIAAAARPIRPISYRAVDLARTALAAVPPLRHAGRPFAEAARPDEALRELFAKIRRALAQPGFELEPPMWRILGLFADTDHERAPLELGHERRTIEDELAQVPNFEVDLRSAATRHQLHEALLQKPYDLVHFSGHHCRDAGLMFEDHRGRPEPFDCGRFIGLVRRRSSIRTLVLNTCDSLAIARHCRDLDYVVAMEGPLGDRAALEFSAGFYRALAKGLDVADAFADARDLAADYLAAGIRPRLLGRCAAGL